MMRESFRFAEEIRPLFPFSLRFSPPLRLRLAISAADIYAISRRLMPPLSLIIDFHCTCRHYATFSPLLRHADIDID
jgi:hypothetical protein